MTISSVQVYIACSIDGFIAGPEHDLSWLPNIETKQTPKPPDKNQGALEYDHFIEGIGILLMGRNTYDVVRGFGGNWPYGEKPVLVATHRPLDDNPPPSVQAIEGEIADLITTAKSKAMAKDVYIDGGNLIRQAAEAGLIDKWTLTFAPIALGKGIPLFAGLKKPYPLEILSHNRFANCMLQIQARPK